VATGDGTKGKDGYAANGDIQLQGAQIQAGRDATLAAARDIALTAGQDTTERDSANHSGSASIGVGFALGGEQNGFTIELAAAAARGKGNGDSTTNHATTVNAGDMLSLTSGRDTTLEGAQAYGNTILADIGRSLSLTSTQDTDHYKETYQAASAGLSLCIPPICYGATSGGASYSQSNISNNYQSVTDQTGLAAGSGGFDIHVGDTTTLTGAAIASTADPSKNLLDTGSLVVKDLHNSAHSSASQMGFSYSSSNSAAGNLAGNAMGAALNMAIPQGGSDSSDTASSIAQGTIVVRDNPDQDLSGIDRSATTLDGNGVGNDFDVDKIREKQALGQAAGYVGMRTVGEWAQSKQKDASDRITAAQNAYAEAQANGDEAGMKQALADGSAALEDFHAWDAGSTNMVLLHLGAGAAVADLGGGNPLQGALGAGGSEALTPLLVDKLDEQNLPWTAAIVGDALGGSAGAATAVDGAQYNYLSHKQKDMEKQEKDACGLNVACLAQVNAKWSAISGEQNIGYAVGVGAGLGIGAYDMGAGIIKTIGSPVETLAGVKALINDPAFRASVGNAMADDYAERIDRMMTAYEDAGWDGSVTAGVEVGRLIFDVAGAVEAAGGVAKLGVSATTKAGKVIKKVGEVIKSKPLVESEKGTAAIANAYADAEAGTSVAVTNSSATGGYVPNAGSDAAAAGSTSSVWSLSPIARGNAIESSLAHTEYSTANGWYQVGAENNGYFPLVDFQQGDTLVSLKTVDTGGSTWMGRMESTIDDLANNGATVNDQPANMVLDLRVQPGGAQDAQPLINYGRQRGVNVIVKEYP